MNSKRKHTSIWQEISFGSIALLIASPLIAYAMVLSVFALIAGFSYLSRGVEFAPSLITASVLSIVALGYALSQTIKRFRMLKQMRQLRDTESTRLDASHLHRAEHRLIDEDYRQEDAMPQQTSPRKYFTQG